MDFTQYTSVKNQFTTDPNLCDLFKLLAVETWKRVEFAYIKPKMKVFETTLTQNLIFSINAYKEQHSLDIDIFEALDETRNGNDLELIIRYPDEGVEFYAPIQAKKIYRNGKYTKLEHHGQIESLAAYAALNNAKPLYLLYNFTPQPLKPGVTLANPIELYGCTLVPAQYLYNNFYNKRAVYKDGIKTFKWKIPDFYDLHPSNAFHWHELVCPDSSADLYTTLSKRGIVPETRRSASTEVILSREEPTGFFPINTFVNDGAWINIKDVEVRGDSPERRARAVYMDDSEKREVSNGEEKRGQQENRSYKYLPKSRVVLTKRKPSNLPF